MILSHANQLIFVKTKKVGGTSLEIALSSICGAHDVITPISPEDERTRRGLGYRGAQNYRKPLARWDARDWLRFAYRRRAPRRFWNHMSAASIRAEVGDSVWDRYLTFTVIRDPFDYVVSRFFWLHRNVELGEPPKAAFRRYLLSHPHHVIENMAIHGIDQGSSLDVVVRYEHLEDDLAELSARLGLDFNLHERMRALRAKSSQRPAAGASTREMFDGFPEGVELVSILARSELERGGYAPPRLAGAEAR